MKKYQQHQEQKLHWKMARVGEYFPSETVATLDEEIVNVCSTLGAQIKDWNRNHNLRLSEEQIATLVQLRHPLKACMVEPRLTYIDNKLHEQVQKEWREFFAQHHAHITLLYSQRKFQEILDFMRKNSEIFAHIPPEATAVMSSPTDVIGLRVNNGGK